MKYFLALSVLFVLAGCVSETSSGINEPVNFEEAAKTRISLGLTYLRGGNYSQAKMNLDKALEFAPRLAEANYSLAYYFQVVGEAERAEEFYENAIKAAPRDPDIANMFGAFLCEQGRYKEAKEYFVRAVSSTTYSNTAQTYENMAICAQQEGYFSEAIEYLQSALNHQPGRTKALVLLAELYTDTEQYEEAALVLRRIERYKQISDKIVWMRMLVAKSRDNWRKAQTYGEMLISTYPDSPYTAQYIREPVVLPEKEEQRPLIPSAPVSEEDEPEVPEFHIVAEGENLFRISILYNITMQRLIDWNQLKDASDIQIGKKVWLTPPDQR